MSTKKEEVKLKQECNLCHNEIYLDNSQIVQLSCCKMHGVQFHRECMQKWINKRSYLTPKCPSCKTLIPTDDNMAIYIFSTILEILWLLFISFIFASIFAMILHFCSLTTILDEKSNDRFWCHGCFYLERFIGVTTHLFIEVMSYFVSIKKIMDSLTAAIPKISNFTIEEKHLSINYSYSRTFMMIEYLPPTSNDEVFNSISFLIFSSILTGITYKGMDYFGRVFIKRSIRSVKS